MVVAESAKTLLHSCNHGVCRLKPRPHAELRLEGVDVEMVIDLSNENAKFDLQFSVTEVGAVLRTRVEYATDLFDAGTIDRMIGHWRMFAVGPLIVLAAAGIAQREGARRGGAQSAQA